MADTSNPLVYDALLAVKPPNLTLGGWATRAGLARNVFNNIREHGNPKQKTLDKLLGVDGVSEARFYAHISPVRSEVRSAGAVGARELGLSFDAGPAAPLPLHGAAVGGEYGEVDEHVELTELHLGEVLEYLNRPASLASDQDAYALTIVGDSMVPRFKPGERVAVSPRAGIAIGDDVIVQLVGSVGDDDRVTMVLVKELARRGGGFVELKQHNPPVTFRLEERRIARDSRGKPAIHKVTGTLF